MTSDTFRIPNLKDKVAVVTGASRGIGRGIALVLSEAGATVYVTGEAYGAARPKISQAASTRLWRLRAQGVAWSSRCAATIQLMQKLRLFSEECEKNKGILISWSTMFGVDTSNTSSIASLYLSGSSRSVIGMACLRRA